MKLTVNKEPLFIGVLNKELFEKDYFDKRLDLESSFKKNFFVEKSDVEDESLLVDFVWHDLNLKELLLNIDNEQRKIYYYVFECEIEGKKKYRLSSSDERTGEIILEEIKSSKKGFLVTDNGNKYGKDHIERMINRDTITEK